MPVAVSSVIVGEHGEAKQRRAVRRFRRTIDKQGFVYAWVVLSAPTVGIEILAQDMTEDEMAAQMAVVDSTLNRILGPLAARGSIRRSPDEPLRNGISELVKVYEMDTVLTLVSLREIEQVSLDLSLNR